MCFATDMPARLTRSFYRRDPVTVARALLGQKLVRMHRGYRLAGVIVETEAYLGIPDKAAHTFNGRRTPRNESMWQDGGYIYVYFTYGMHHCVNVVAGCEGDPVAVLLRSIEPAEGIEQMFRQRKKAKSDTDLCSGPAKLAAALAIDRKLDGIDLTKDGHLFIEKTLASCLRAKRIGVSPRIGIQYAQEWVGKPLRFYDNTSKYLSR